MLAESQRNISVKFSPLSLIGVRTAISLKRVILAFSTPTVKKATRLLASSSLIRCDTCSMKLSGSAIGYFLRVVNHSCNRLRQRIHKQKLFKNGSKPDSIVSRGLTD